MREVIIRQFCKDLARKNIFFWGGRGLLLVQVQKFGTATSYGLVVLYQSGKKVKTKSQKVFGANSYICRSYMGSDRGLFWSPILNRVKRFSCLTGHTYLNALIPLVQIALRYHSLMLFTKNRLKRFK